MIPHELELLWAHGCYGCSWGLGGRRDNSDGYHADPAVPTVVMAIAAAITTLPVVLTDFL